MRFDDDYSSILSKLLFTSSIICDRSVSGSWVTRRNIFLVILGNLYEVTRLFLIRILQILFRRAVFWLSRDLFIEFQKRVSNVTERPTNWTRRPSRGCGRICDLDWPTASERKRWCYALVENSFSFGIALDYVHMHSVTYVFLVTNTFEWQGQGIERTPANI